MAVKRFRPTTPTQRYKTVNSFEDVTASSPEKSLTSALSKSGGRNNRGRITMRRRGGGHKRRYRVVDFKRDKDGVDGKVATIEYDPNRSARIALIHYADGKAIHPRSAGAEGWQPGQFGPGGSHHCWQRIALAEDPSWVDSSQY